MKAFAIVCFLLVVPAIQCITPPGNTFPLGGGSNAGGPVDPTALWQELSTDLTSPNGILKGLGLDNTANSLLTGLLGPNGNLTSLLKGKYGILIADVLRFFLGPDGFVAALIGPKGIFTGNSGIVGKLLNGILGLPDGIVPSLFGPNGVLGNHILARALLGGGDGGLGGLVGGLLQTVVELLNSLLGGGGILGRSIEERAGLLGGVLGLVQALLRALLGPLLGGGGGGGGNGLLGLVTGLLGGLLGGGNNQPPGGTGSSPGLNPSSLIALLQQLGGAGGSQGLDLSSLIAKLQQLSGGGDAGLGSIDDELCKIESQLGTAWDSVYQTCLSAVQSSNLQSLLSTELSGLTCDSTGGAQSGGNSATWIPTLSADDAQELATFLQCLTSPQ